MKLLLTSGGVTNEQIATGVDQLTGMAREGVKVGYIPTAANGEPGNKDWFITQITDLYKHGFKWIDIVDFSASGTDWKTRLSECNVIYISGGNTFHLLNEVRRHSFDAWIHENLNDKVFIGVSAGSILMTPTISIATVEPADINNVGLEDFTALNIVPYEVSPHTPDLLSYESNEAYAQNGKYPLYTFDDNCALLVQDDSVEVVGGGEWRLIEKH